MRFSDRSFYEDAWPLQRERLLPATWHVLGTIPDRAATPLTLLPGSLDEPLLFTRQPGPGGAGEERLLSNVCTHRAAILREQPGDPANLRCPYHGRQFDLSGRLVGAPEMPPGFCAALRGAEDLPEVAHARWGPLLFGALAPPQPFSEWAAPLALLEGMPVDRLAEAPERARCFEVAACWQLWADNYLEGLHVPWVHPGLARSLDWRNYRTERRPTGSVQIGIAPEGAPVLDFPPGHPLAGERVAGLYVALFPMTFLNFYPWGLSLNTLEPLGAARTRVRYRVYVWDASRLEGGAGGDLDTVELEDDAVVERVQRGLRSRLYRGGTPVPGWEDAVLHHHRLLRAALGQEG